MPGMNSTRLFTNAQPSGGGELSSSIVYVQGVRDSLVTFWVHMSGGFFSGSLQIRGAPDEAARNLTSPVGSILHSIIWTGTAGASQTKVNGQGHAVVTVQALPLMWLRIQGVSGTEIANAWIIE